MVTTETRQTKTRWPRLAESYRGARRNKSFGRKPTGNTKPHERQAIRDAR